MHRRSLSAVAAFLLIATSAHAQRKGGGGGGSTMPSAGASEMIVHGMVQLPDAAIPARLVTVTRTCAGRTGQGVFADAKGRFNFNLGVVKKSANDRQTGGTFTDASDLRGCVIRASLPGFRSPAIDLDPFIKSEKTNLGELMLQPVGKQISAALSVTDGDVPPKARKEFDAGLDNAAKSKWPEAIAAMEKATSDDPKYASAWLSLGMLQAATFNNPAALRAFAKAIEVDPKFAAPYIEAAALESAGSEWAKAIENTGYAIALDPEAFPRAYYLNAVAHVRLNDADDAQKRTEAGIRVDVDHEFPDLEYMEGVLLMSNNDNKGARKYLESYLVHAPNGVNAAIARKQLSELPGEK